MLDRRRRVLDYTSTTDTTVPHRKAKYPGRHRVIARDDARTYQFDRTFRPPTRNVCTRPVVIHAMGLPSILDPDDRKHPVDMAARCRKCPECLQHRRELWTARARAEVLFAPRTWFVTLTYNPYQRFRVKCVADGDVQRRRREPLSSLSHEEQYKAMADVASRDVVLWLKRIRKAAGSFRYLQVSEAHSDGFPHFHLLLHEQEHSKGKLTKALLQNQWRAGFSHCKLVKDQRAASYVCKYLSKDARTRVRASQLYGQPQTRLIADSVTQALDALRASAKQES